MSKHIAIIGGGRSGLLTAKHALDSGLTPTIFEKSAEIGGLWSQNNTFIWHSLHANITKYTMTMMDHPWPDNTPLFPSKQEISAYLHSYSNRFDLQSYTKLNTHVSFIRQLQDQRWHVEYLNMSDYKIHSEIFDFVCLASGMQSKPVMPREAFNSPFTGRILHSAEFNSILNNPSLIANKSVLVVGSSHSAIDICAELAVGEYGRPKRIVNLFARTHLVLSRLVRIKLPGTDQFRIIPADFLRNSRAVAYSEIRSTRSDLFKQMCPVQTNRDLIHPDLYVDLDDEKTDFLVSISDRYIELTQQGRIQPIKGVLLQLTSHGVLLTDHRFFDGFDVIVFCTGFEFTFDYLEQSVLNRLKQANGVNNFSLLVSKYTFNPDVENLAINAHVPVVNIAGSELQAKLTCLVFSKKLTLNRSEMRDEIDELRRRMQVNRNKRQGAPYGGYVDICETLGRVLNSVPKSIPSRFYWEGLVLPGQYFFKDVSRDQAEVEAIVNQLYFVSNGSVDSLSFNDLVRIFYRYFKFE